MFPELNEATGSTYLLVLVTLQVFNLGLPGLILHLTPDGVRRVAEHYQGVLFFRVLNLNFYIMFMSLIFTWFLYPFPAIPLPAWTGWGAGHAVALAFVWSVIVWYRMAGSSIVESLVKYLSKKLRKGNWGIHGKQINHLDDLFMLGIYGDPVHEKNIVIRETNRIIQHIQESNSYDGGQLGILSRKLPEILINSEKSGSDENFQDMLDVVQNAKRTLQSMSTRFLNPEDTPDYTILKSVLGIIALNASTSKSLTLQINTIEAVYDDSIVLLQIGLKLIDSGNIADSGNMALVVKILNKLESLAEGKGLGENIESVCLLALQIYCIEKGGDALKASVLAYLEDKQNDFTPNLETVVEYAQRELQSRYLTTVIDAMTKLIPIPATDTREPEVLGI